MIGYYFSAINKKLRYGDNRVIRRGRTHKVSGTVMLCKKGLHASKKPLDALGFAPGPYLWLVELGGEIVHGNDKSVATERTYLRGFNAEKLLQKFARKQALINIEKIRPYTDSYDVIIEWLETGNENIKSAARLAAELAAESAAESATESAARAAARAAAWSAARSAAWSAVWSAARAAVWAAARLAAWSAAESATESAAESAANEMLQAMIDDKFKEMGR